MADTTPYDLSPLIASWVRSLRSRNLSPATIKVYERSARGLAEYLATYKPPHPDARPAPVEIDDIHREHVEGYITHLLEKRKPPRKDAAPDAQGEKLSTSSVHQQFRSLKTLFGWLVDEEEMDRSPMRTMKPPTLPEVEVPVIPEDALARLIKACAGRDFESRRDTAILMMFLDTGARLSELTVRNVEHVDLDQLVLVVVGKGNRQRSVPFGRATATAVDRYFRAYAKHIGRPLEKDGSDPLWIGVKSKRPFTIWGVGQMLERRAAQAGLEHIHPHQFRHTLAHMWKTGGGNEDALMRIMGWRSREMLSRYGASAGAERARQEHRDLSPGDRLQK